MPPCPIVPAEAGDLPGVLDLLRRNELSTDGVAEHFEWALVARLGDRVVGCALLELHGECALLRSVAVADDLRGTGVGHALTSGAMAIAARAGALDAYLLTTTATGFFPKLGFRRVDRESVPAALRASSQFTGECPASARVFTRPLDPVAEREPCET